jgi:hypothetical protein
MIEIALHQQRLQSRPHHTVATYNQQLHRQCTLVSAEVTLKPTGITA